MQDVKIMWNLLLVHVIQATVEMGKRALVIQTYFRYFFMLIFP